MIRPYITVINILLSLLVLFLVNEIYSLWKPGEAKDVSGTTTQTEALVEIPDLRGRRIPPRKTYQHIVEKDLFRPERTEWVPPATPKEEEPSQIGEPKIRVYGIVIYNDLKNAWIKEQLQKATVNQSRRTSRSGRSSTKNRTQIAKSHKLKKVTEGDSIEGWVVTTIKPDAVVLKSGESSKEFHLIEHNDPKARVIPRHLQVKQPKKKPTRPEPQKSTSNRRPPVGQPKKSKR